MNVKNVIRPAATNVKFPKKGKLNRFSSFWNHKNQTKKTLLSSPEYELLYTNNRMSICLCLLPRISKTTRLMWFSCKVKLFIGPEKFGRGVYTPPPPPQNEKTPLEKYFWITWNFYYCERAKDCEEICRQLQLKGDCLDSKLYKLSLCFHWSLI